ncbi:MAG TPA: nuclear transport factor 2 family protein [Longimicrobiales bacterium]|nr:nuclear transport factor 2 family protein [Longimicrobiales bacterium]
MALLAALLEIERPFWTGGADYYRENLAPEFLMLFPGAGFLDRAGAIRGVEGGRRWTGIEISDARLVSLGPASVVLAYSARAEREGDAGPYRALVSSVYLRHGGAWRLAFHQQSPL